MYHGYVKGTEGWRRAAYYIFKVSTLSLGHEKQPTGIDIPGIWYRTFTASQKGKESSPPAKIASALACDDFLPAVVKQWLYLGQVIKRWCLLHLLFTHLLAGCRGFQGPKEWLSQASLVVQWIGIHLPVQESRVRSLVQEDLTSHRATKPECHNYWSPHTESLCSAARDATAMRNPSTARKAQCDQKKKKERLSHKMKGVWFCQSSHERLTAEQKNLHLTASVNRQCRCYLKDVVWKTPQHNDSNFLISFIFSLG